MTMSEDRHDPWQPKPWWDVPAAATEPPWPRPGLTARSAWAEEADSYSGRGLRSGLLAALHAVAEEGEYEIDSEQQLLWLAIYLLTDLMKAGDEQLAWLIAEARHKGLSWAEVGEALGISKQGAHKRFAQQVESNRTAAFSPELWG
jgi:hypothetical protein